MKTASVKCVAVTIAIGVMTLSLGGCATILKGTHEEVAFISDPSGAKVFVNGQYIGITPVKANLDARTTYAVDFKKDGYESRSAALHSSTSGGLVILDILFGFWPIIFDAATGAWSTFDQNVIGTSLDKK